MSSSGLKRTVSEFGIALLSMVLAFSTEVSACPQEKITEYVRDLSEMSTRAENSLRYLVPRFRECGQAAIASELEGSPEWLLSMRQHLQASASNPVELKTTIESALANLNKAETSLQKNYGLVLQGIDSMYDNRFPPKCRNERNQIVANMKSTRPLVPVGIEKLNGFKACLGAP